MAEGRDIPIAEQEKGPAKRPPWWKRLWARTGFGDKTVWDLLQLLIVPLALAGVGLWFTTQQDARQRELEEQRAQDAALQAYLDQMGQLMLEKDLRSSEEDSEVRTLARARTLTVLRRLDSSRKAAVMQFLEEAELVQRVEERDPIIDLSDADLSGSNLESAALPGVNLSFANLSGAQLDNGSVLDGASLRGADLRDADLSYGNLPGANLDGANLDGANLTDADLTAADLRAHFKTSY